MAERPCKQPPITQISTGQAGPEVNRDLENLFAAVNRLMRCVSKISDFIDAGSGNSFDGGASSGNGGGGGGTGGGPNPPIPNEPPLLTIASGSNVTLPDHFSGWAFIEPTADIDVVAGLPKPGGEMFLQNTSATFAITFKDDLGNTVGMINPGQLLVSRTFMDANGAPAHNTGAVVYSAGGTVYVPDDVVFRGGNPVTIDTTDGHYVEHSVTADAFVGVDTGTTEEPGVS